nr:glycoside hydrolase family 3 N-terminal domain-containing protein [uncultured Friedmanniella sp.]
MTSDGPGRRRRGFGPAALLLGPLTLGLAACGLPGAAPGPAGPPSSTPTGPVSAPGTASAAARSSATPSPSTTTSTPTPSASPSARCADLVRRLTLEERVGQLLMVAVTSTGVTPEQASVVGRTHAGSVILLGNSTAGLAAVQSVVADVREAAVRPQQVDVLLAADQEGGMVQRLAGEGFSDIPSAEQQAKLSRAELTADAEAWGEQLAKAGIHADLAPVADVVPAELAGVNEPIGKLRRGYGSSPKTVAQKVAAFTTGMDNAGIATAVKHFPGLGRVRGNTDFTSRVVDTVTTRKDAGLAGFRAAVDAGADMVMISSAVYDRIDPRRQAVFSEAVVDGMVRDGLGFDGVVISDDLSAAAVQNLRPGQRAVAFVRAGGDLVIVGDPGEAAAMAEALVERAGSDRDFAERVDQSAARVLALKNRRGLTGC